MVLFVVGTMLLAAGLSQGSGVAAALGAALALFGLLMDTL